MIVSAAFDGGLAACRLAQREIMMAIASKRHSVRRNTSDLTKSHPPCVSAAGSERRRSVYPQNPSLAATGILPAMGRRTFEIKTIAGPEPVFLPIERNLQLAPQNVEKFLALVRVRFAAAGLGSDAEQMWLHNRIAPREQFHAHARPSFQNFAAVRTYQAAVRFRRIEEIKNLGFVKARQFAKRPDGGTHLRTLDCTQKSQRDAYRFGYFCERQPALCAQLAEANADCTARPIGAGADHALAFEHLHDCRGIQTANFAEKAGPLEQLDIFWRVEPVFAGGALWTRKAEALPGADHRRRHAHQTGHVSNFQVRFGIGGRHFRSL